MATAMSSETADRVKLLYQTEINGRQEEVELPLRILVLGDFTGDARSASMDEAEILPVTDSGIEGLFKRLQPQVRLRVRDHLADGDDWVVQAALNALDDFQPQALIRQTPELAAVAAFIDALAESMQSERLDDLEAEQQALVERFLRAENLDWRQLQENLREAGWLMASLEERLGAQLDAILHHPDFAALEAAWRALDFLLRHIDFGENIEVSVLNISKQGLMEDFEDAPEVTQAALYQRVYSDEFGQFGGRPYSVMIGNYDFGPQAPDIKLMQKLAAVGAISHAPFIAAASHRFFHIEAYSAFSKLRDIASIFQQPGYEKWNAFRKSEDARYIGLTLPGFLLRPPHHVAIGSFEYQEKVQSTDNDLLWGNAAFALATRIADSFARYRWCLNMTGREGGCVDGLRNNLAGAALQAGRIPTRFLLTDKRESDVVAQGFIPLSVHKGDDCAAFYSASSVHDFRHGGDAGEGEDLSARLGAQLPYLLVISRIAHYIKIIQREHIGAWKNRHDVDHELNTWLKQYVSDMDNPAPGVRARRPLRRAEIKVREVEGKGDWYATRIRITPHIKYMGERFTLSENTRLEKN